MNTGRETLKKTLRYTDTQIRSKMLVPKRPAKNKTVLNSLTNQQRRQSQIQVQSFLQDILKALKGVGRKKMNKTTFYKRYKYA